MRAGRAGLAAALIAVAAPAAATAQVEPVRAGELPYRAPRAGEGFEEELFGVSVSVPRRDRRKTLALTLGGAWFDPPIAGDGGSPIFNVYWVRYWNSRRIFGLFSGAYDQVEYAERLYAFDDDQPGRGMLEGVALFENYTVPATLRELRGNGRRAEDSALYWGRVALEVGPGVRRALWPFAVESDLRVQLLAHAEWQYFDEAHDTPDAAIIPPETFVYGGRLRARLDMLERNLLEMPHLGLAAGVDLDALRRDPWQEPGLLGPDGQRNAPKDHTRDVLRVSGHVLTALPVPWLSERHRLVAQLHAGWAPTGSLDRFSAFRFGAGPHQTEHNDLPRVSFPVAAFNGIAAEQYLVGALAYRFEALFFLFPHVRVTAAWGRVGQWEPETWRLRFERRGGVAVSAGFTSGFAFASQLYVEASWGRGFSREREGQSVLVMWSKSF